MLFLIYNYLIHAYFEAWRIYYTIKYRIFARYYLKVDNCKILQRICILLLLYLRTTKIQSRLKKRKEITILSTHSSHNFFEMAPRVNIISIQQWIILDLRTLSSFQEGNITTDFPSWYLRSQFGF